MIHNLIAHSKREPIAAVAIVLTATLAIVQSDWFDDLFRSSVELNAHYREQDDGRCSLVAFSIDNNTEGAASDIRINIITDWIVRSGREELLVVDREAGLIGSGEQTPIEFREVLDVKYETEGDTLIIPILLPDEYLDLFVARMIDVTAAKLRKQLADDMRYRYTPRVGTASFAEGRLAIIDHGDCIQEFHST